MFPADTVRERLLGWFAEHGRDLPWRRTRDPYAILVAEMMLQQTGVERVLPKYAAWLERYPTLQSLAEAPTSEVIRLWSGLGYNSRAVRLQGIARQAVERYGGRVPHTMAELRTLKGIGPYTAGAIACFAHEQDVAFVDTNVRRVLSRVFLGTEGPPSERELIDLAEEVLPRGRSWDWHQALMDLGAAICTDGKPACLICPLQGCCRAAFRAGRVVREAGTGYQTRRKEGPWRGSTRYYRGRIVAALGALQPGERLTLPALALKIGLDGTQNDAPSLDEMVRRLAADGLAALDVNASGEIAISLPE